MTVRLELFGRLAQECGADLLDLELQPGSNLRDVATLLTCRDERLAWIPAVCRPARNLEYASWDDEVADGDRVSFIPPVSGGAPDDPATVQTAAYWVAVLDEVLQPTALESFVAGPEMGAVCTFTGNVRDHNRGRTVGHLVYEGYRPMAVREMERIARAAVERFQCRIAIFHRLGRLEIGEASVIVSVGCGHRAAAFEACRFAIDTLKEAVPIWKREVWAEGDVWIEGPGEAAATAA